MEDRIQKLRELLDQQEYPSIYMYKFIVKNDKDKIVQIKRCFSESAEFSTNTSGNGNYVSVSINLNNSQINLFRSQTTLTKGNALFPILKRALAIPASCKAALTFILCTLISHDDHFINYSG